MGRPEALYERLCQVAAGLNEPNDPDAEESEYLRGQIELICDATGVHMDDREHVKFEVMRRARFVRTAGRNG